MSPRSRHHLLPTLIGKRESTLVVEKPFAVVVLIAALSMAVLVIGVLSMAARTPWPDTATSEVALDSGLDGAVSDDREYPRTVTQFGRLVAIDPTSVSIQDERGAVLAFTITTDTILVPAFGVDAGPVNEQFVRNERLVIISHRADGMVIATAVVDPGPARRDESRVPLILA